MRVQITDKLGVILTLSQRNVRELFHLTQAAQAQGHSDLPYLVKGAPFTEAYLVVQVERDDVHYDEVGYVPDPLAEYDGHPDKARHNTAATEIE